MESVLNLRKNLGVCQHHDAVAGTAKEYVSENYIKMLSDSVEKCRVTLNEILDKLIEFPVDHVNNCINPVSNINCQHVVYPLNEQKTVMLIFANNRVGRFPVSFKSQDSKLKIYNISMDLIESDIFCDEDEGANTCSVYFEQDFTSQYIFNLIIIEKTNYPRNVEILKNVNNNFDLSKNNDFRVVFKQGNLSIYLPEFNQVYNITLSHSTYIGKAENQSSLIRPSDSNPDGAYVFAPLNSYPDKDKLDLAQTVYWNGQTVKQLLLVFQKSRMLVKFFRSLDYTIEVESIFEPLTKNSTEIEEGLSKVLHIESNVDNSIVIKNISISNKPRSRGKTRLDTVSIAQPEFWTDSNGMKMMRRYKDFRGGWDYYITDPVSANFYPVNYAISIREKSLIDYNKFDYSGIREDDPMITVFTERSQSGGAMKQGEIMLLMNRYSKNDDWKGLNENLYEKISLNNHFRMNNWISFSSYFKKAHITDYIHKRPTIFSFDLHAKFKDHFILKEFLAEKFGIESFLKDIISHESCIIPNFHIISQKEILLQAYNHNDPYFTSKKACSIHFKPNLFVNYSFEEISVSGTQKLNTLKDASTTLRKNLGKGRSYLHGSIFVDPHDVKLFSLTFN